MKTSVVKPNQHDFVQISQPSVTSVPGQAPAELGTTCVTSSYLCRPGTNQVAYDLSKGGQFNVQPGGYDHVGVFTGAAPLFEAPVATLNYN